MIKVFMYWDKGYKNMSPMIKTIYQNNVYFCNNNNLELILLDDNNINEYITLHKRFYELENNFKSDIARYYVLDKYGGFWFDTDIIIIKDIQQIYNLLSEDIDIILDEEHHTKIGCASICMKNNSICSNY